MISLSVRQRIHRSRLLSLFVLPYRIFLVSRFLLSQSAVGAKWLLRSREFTNFTYDLTDRNKDYLAWFVSGLTGESVDCIEEYFDELENDLELKSQINSGLKKHHRSGEVDSDIYFGRRLGWYAIIRSLKPSVVVETGTEKGIGSCVIAAALLRNQKGHLTTIDIDQSSGFLIGSTYANVVSHVKLDSLTAIQTLNNIDLFIHDSDHSASHESDELQLCLARLNATAVVISDNAHNTCELSIWSKTNHRKFLYFAEEPKNHWYRGAGIGVSVGGNGC